MVVLETRMDAGTDRIGSVFKDYRHTSLEADKKCRGAFDLGLSMWLLRGGGRRPRPLIRT